MREKTAKVKNISKLLGIGQALEARAPGVPGIALAWGATGYGKTTAALYLVGQTEAVFVRANALWTPRSMLGAIVHELGGKEQQSAGTMFEFAKKKLSEDPRPLVIDEGDYLTSSTKLLDVLRDLHDTTKAPLILIGMEDFKRKVLHRPQLANRVSQWIEFGQADVEDTRVIVDEVSEVQIADDLVEKIREQTGGAPRGIVVAVQHVEALAHKRGLDRISLRDWGDKPLVFRLPAGKAT